MTPEPAPPLADIDAVLRRDPTRWAWRGMALVFAGAGVWVAAHHQVAFTIALVFSAGLCLSRPLHRRIAFLAGYDAGWTDRGRRR